MISPQSPSAGNQYLLPRSARLGPLRGWENGYRIRATGRIAVQLLVPRRGCPRGRAPMCAASLAPDDSGTPTRLRVGVASRGHTHPPRRFGLHVTPSPVGLRHPARADGGAIVPHPSVQAVTFRGTALTHSIHAADSLVASTRHARRRPALGRGSPPTPQSGNRGAAMTTRCWCSLLVAALVLTCPMAVEVSAQVTTGDITGRVLDTR